MTSEELRSGLDSMLEQLSGMERTGPDFSRLDFMDGYLVTLKAEARTLRDDGAVDPGWMLALDGDLDKAGRKIGQLRMLHGAGPGPVRPAGFQGVMARAGAAVRLPKAERPARPKRNMEQFIGGSVMSVMAAGLIFIAMILFGMTLLPLLPEIARLAVLAAVSGAVAGFGYYKAQRDWSSKIWLTILAIGIGGLFVTMMLGSVWYNQLAVQTLIYLGILGWSCLCRALSRKSDLLFTIISQVGITIAAIAAYWSGFEFKDRMLLDMLSVFLLASGAILLYRNYSARNILIHMTGLGVTGGFAAMFYQDAQRIGEWFAYDLEPVPTSAPLLLGQALLIALLLFVSGIFYILMFRATGLSSERLDGKVGRVMQFGFQVLLLYLLSSCASLLGKDPILVGGVSAVYCFLYLAFQPGELDAFSLLSALVATGCFLDEEPMMAVVFLILLLNVSVAKDRMLVEGACVGLLGFVLFATMATEADMVTAWMTLAFAANMAFWDMCGNRLGDYGGTVSYIVGLAVTGYAALAFGKALLVSANAFILMIQLSAALGAVPGVLAVGSALFYTEKHEDLIAYRFFDRFPPYVLRLCVPPLTAVLVSGIYSELGSIPELASNFSWALSIRAWFIALAAVLTARTILPGRNVQAVKRAASALACFFGLAFLVWFSFRDEPYWHFAVVLLVLIAHSLNLKALAQGRFGPYYMTAKSAGLFWIIIESYQGPGWLSTASFFLLAAALLYAGYRMGRKNMRLSGILLICFGICKLLLADFHYESDLMRTASFFFAGLLCLGISTAYHKIGVGGQADEPADPEQEDAE